MGKINYDETLTGLEDLDWAKKQYEREGNCLCA